MKQCNNQKGFTLVEIAIVLVIIGLLLGGVLKGQSMIENAKVKSLANTAKSLTAAIYSYQDKYKAYPGDDPRATINLPGASGGCVAADLVNGNGDGTIDEYFAALEHLACAGFITGAFNGTSDLIKHPYGGTAYVFNQTIQGKAGNLIRFDNLPADVARDLDTMLDDAIFNRGSIRASADYVAGTVIANTGYYY
jgi:prepilin-type N-terminal cleavage/methylation domain-containing protein